MNRIRLLIAGSVLFALGNVGVSSLARQQTEAVEWLAYTIYDYREGSSLMLFDPAKRIHVELYQSDNRLNFRLSPTGQVAFSSWTDNEILLVNTKFTDLSPINISQASDLRGYPLGWSRNGRYLAFSAYEDVDVQDVFSPDSALYLWDNETQKAVNITPTDLATSAERYNIAWSYDEKLAITMWFGFGDDTLNPEIYVWDGETTFNLSQNPTGTDRDPTWNKNGQIAFLSAQNDEYDIFVWDGRSFKNGIPDVDSFNNIAPALSAYYSYPVWTPDGNIAFLALASQDKNIQIYLWDGQTTTNISQEPSSNNGIPRWSSNGSWAFVTGYGLGLYVHDSDNRIIFTETAIYPPAWSRDGNLIFCNADYSGVSMWDGHDVHQIISGWEIWAQWQGGEGVVCSSG